MSQLIHAGRRLTALALTVTACVLPHLSDAQSDPVMPRVGFLAPQGRSLPLFDAFRQGLADAGYIEGRNVIIEARFADGQFDRFPDLLADLTRLKVNVIAVTGAVTARAAKRAVSDTPIVFSMVVDPVADHVISSLEHPGGNITGTTSFDPQQARKQLELMREAVPTIKRIAILGDQGVSAALITAAETEARAMSLEALTFRVTAPSPHLEDLFSTIRQQHADAVLVLEEPAVGVYAKDIADLASVDRLPTLFAPSRVAAGGLLAYGTSQVASVRRMATYVDKILKGAKPGDLAVERVTPYELIVNLRTARAIGVTVPPQILKRADQVIQ